MLQWTETRYTAHTVHVSFVVCKHGNAAPIICKNGIVINYREQTSANF